MLIQHYVTFYSPGTFVSEEDVIPVEKWDVDEAVARARTVTQRYGATPYGFRFTTRGREDSEIDSKQIAKSSFYWLGGTVETLAEVKARATEHDRILVSNMEINHFDHVITNNNSYRFTSPIGEDDVVLDFEIQETA